MEALGQLTGGIAHDFNNMLRGVGNIDLPAPPRKGVTNIDQFSPAAGGRQTRRRADAASARFARQQRSRPSRSTPTDWWGACRNCCPDWRPVASKPF